MNLSYLDEMLGSPPFRRVHVEAVHQPESVRLLESVWIDQYCFLHVFSDETDRRVRAVSITTRDRRFQPTFMVGHTISDSETLEITLGQTMFTDLPGWPDEIVGGVGNRRWGYTERFYFGNPGMYQTYLYSVNDGGFSPNYAYSLMSAIPDGRIDATGKEVAGALTELGDARCFPINTFTVVASFEQYPEFQRPFSGCRYRLGAGTRGH